MKTIYDFKKGDKIVRIQPAKPYQNRMRDRSYMGEKLIFVGIANGQIYCKRTDRLSLSIFGDELLGLALDVWDEGWDLFIDPKTLSHGLIRKWMQKLIKTIFTLFFALLCMSLSAQVNNYKVNSSLLLKSFEKGEISKESYIDISRMQLNKLHDSIHIVAQKPHYSAALDLALIGGGVLYQKFGKNVKYDYILHAWGGYFATKAMIFGLDKAGASKATCAIVPPLVTSALCLLKEYMIDSTPSKGDLYAGIGGAGLASISYSIDLEKIFRRK